MIIDAHCHAWEHWPYTPPVPDGSTRGSLEQLVFEMDRNGVDRALIVCAEIQGNPHNNLYVYEETQAYRGRFDYVVDVDSMWKDSYHTAGAADRLTEAITKWNPAGLTHYLANDAADGRWLYSDDGLAMFEVAEQHNLLLSIHCHPQHQTHIRELAQRYPQRPILIHHMGHPKILEPEGLAEILSSAAHENIFIKVSGFYNSTAAPPWDYPLADVQPIVQTLYNRYGAQRLLWGSDYPVCRRYFTHRHALEIVRHHCRFIPSSEMAYLLGKNLENLLT